MTDLRIGLRVHRGWVYLGTALFLLVALIFIPIETAYAADGAVQSSTLPTRFPAPGAELQTPADWREAAYSINNMADASRYLAWNRWYTSNAIGTPSATLANIGSAVAAGMAVFSKLLLTVASFIIYIVGQILVLAVGFNLLGRTANAVDYIFAQIGRGVLGIDGTMTGRTWTFAGFMLVCLALYVVFNVVRRGLRYAIRTLVLGLVALAALGIMTTQATKNHDSVGTIASGRAPDLIETPRSNPDSWEEGSPGWVIAQGTRLGNRLNNVVTGAMTSLTNVVGSVSDAEVLSGECAMYVDAMHRIYSNGGKFSSLPLQYDNLALSLYFETYRMAAFGDQGGSDGAWCRVSEVIAGAPAAEQAMIAREAGLYKEAIGHAPSGYDGTVINASGNFTQAQDSPKALQSLFGPNFVQSSSLEKLTAYWAACDWSRPGGSVAINPAWSGVHTADHLDREWWQQIHPIASIGTTMVDSLWDTLTGGDVLNTEMCRNVITGAGGADGISGLLGNEGTGGVGFDRNATQADEFYFHEETAGVSGLFAVRVAGAAPLFSPKVDQGDDRALNYYMATQGMTSPWTLAIAFIALVLAITMAKYILPVIVGGLIAQGMGVIAWVFGVFVLVMMIIPFPRFYRVGKTAGLTIVWSFVAATLYTVVIGLILTMFNMFRSIFYDPNSAQLIKIIQLGLAAFVAFFIVKTLLKNFLNYDMSSFRSAVRSAGVISGRALLQEQGHQLEPIFRRRTAEEASHASRMPSPFRSAADRARQHADAAARAGIDALVDRGKKSFGGKSDPTAADPTAAEGAAGAAAKGAENKPAPGTAGAGTAPGGAKQPVRKPANRPLGNATGIVASYVGDKEAERIANAPDITKNLPKETAEQLADGAVGLSESKRPFVQPDSDEVRKMMERFGGNGELARASSGMGDDVDPLIRTYTAADLFHGARPLTSQELSRMSLEDREAYMKGRLDVVSTAGEGGPKRWYAVPPSAEMADPTKMVRDPYTGMMVPRGLVVAGSPAARAAVPTRNGLVFSGMERGEGGIWRPQDIGTARVASPRLLESDLAPSGVNQQVWDSFRDLQSWMKQNNLQPDVTDPAMWPEGRRAQFVALTEHIEGVYGALGFRLPDISDEQLAASGIGLMPSPTVPSIPDMGPDSEFQARLTALSKNPDLALSEEGIAQAASEAKTPSSIMLEQELAKITAEVNDVRLQETARATQGRLEQARLLAQQQITAARSSADSIIENARKSTEQATANLRRGEAELARRMMDSNPNALSRWADHHGGPLGVVSALERGEISEHEVQAALIAPAGEIAGHDPRVAEVLRQVTRDRESVESQVREARVRAAETLRREVTSIHERRAMEEVRIMEDVVRDLAQSADAAAQESARRLQSNVIGLRNAQDMTKAIRSWFQGVR